MSVNTDSGREGKAEAEGRAVCPVCFRHCVLNEGQTGACHARKNEGGSIKPLNYGMLTSLALDPVEKKPLRRFFPGKKILSVGSYGCNLQCPFCQNHEIAAVSEAPEFTEFVSPERLFELARAYKSQGNIGLAFTYNEPTICYEFVRDAAGLCHEGGMKNVLVTNGCASQEILRELLPYVDAMNIDLKSFRPEIYRDFLHGNLDTVLDFITLSARHAHVELTTLIIPGVNDTEEEMREISAWIHELEAAAGKSIPLHISRFFPRFHLTDRNATDPGLIYRLRDVAKEKLSYVYTGNC